MVAARASLEQLLDDHRQIDDRASDILRLMDSQPIDTSHIEGALQQLADLIIVHSTRESSLIHAVGTCLQAMGRHRQHAELSAALDRLQLEWDGYIGAWPTGSVARDIARFRRETRNILPEIQAQVRIESELLYFTALRHGLIALRSADDGISADRQG